MHFLKDYLLITVITDTLITAFEKISIDIVGQSQLTQNMLKINTSQNINKLKDIKQSTVELKHHKFAIVNHFEKLQMES